MTPHEAAVTASLVTFLFLLPGLLALVLEVRKLRRQVREDQR